MRSGAEVCKSCRSRQELSNEYLLEKVGFDTAENEPINFHNFSSLLGFNFHRAVVSGAPAGWLMLFIFFIFLFGQQAYPP